MGPIGIFAFVLFALSAAMPRETSRELAALEKQFEAARADLQTAETELVAAYERVEASFQSHVSDPTRRAALALALGDGVRATAAQFQDRITGKRAGKPPIATVQKTIAAEWLSAALATTSLEIGLRPVLANSAADSTRVALVGDPNAPELAAALSTAIDGFFTPPLDFAEIWNDGVFSNVPEAVRYAKSFANYREIGVKVDRARSPEKFDDSGQRLPPGMLLVKGGQYDSGPDQGFVRKGLEKRAAKFSVKPFFIDRMEVTNADYLKFIKGLPVERQRTHLPSTWAMKEDGTIATPLDHDDHPVAGVSWNDAFEYAKSLGKRLPTEDEWEAAARGPKGQRFPWGATYESGRANTRDTGRGDTTAVGSFPDGASFFGCLDLAGNVEEWTATTMDGEVIEAPLGSSLIQMVIRGGNFNSNQDGVAATFRWYSPGLSTKKPTLGFRCAMSVPK